MSKLIWNTSPEYIWIVFFMTKDGVYAGESILLLIAFKRLPFAILSYYLVKGDGGS